MPLSVCIVAGAEAHRIGRTLDSVQALAAEILVVINQEVNDGTDTICQGYGASVYREPWKGFIGQKNSVATRATQPWLLNLDADEVLSPALTDELAQVVRANDPRFAAYEFPRCTFYCGRWIRHGDWYPDRVCRLWRRDRARWAGVEPHARLDVEGRTGRLRSDLLHYSNESIDRTLAKIGPYSAYYVQRRMGESRAGWDRWDMLGRPLWKFFRAYILRLGFLDGWPGYFIAWMNAFSTVTRHAKVLEARLAAEGRLAPPDVSRGAGSR